jgi:hypothetical protein
MDEAEEQRRRRGTHRAEEEASGELGCTRSREQLAASEASAASSVVKEQRGASGAEEKASAELGPGARGAGQRRVCQDPFHRQSTGCWPVAFPDRPRGFNI